MSALFRLVLAGLLVSSAHSAQAQIEGALNTVRLYSAAFAAADCEAIYALTAPALKAREQDPSLLAQQLCSLAESLKTSNTAEALGEPIAYLEQDQYRLAIVPFQRSGKVSSSQSRTLVTKAQYWVHSADGGATWKVLDLGCIDARWAKLVYPPYAGFPPAQPAQAELLPTESAP